MQRSPDDHPSSVPVRVPVGDWLRAQVGRVRRRDIGIRPVAIGADRVFVDSVDRYLAAMAWKFGWRDGPVQRLIARLVTAGMIAVDVGANVGWYTLALARQVGPQGRVYALEPEPRNVDLLSRAVGGGRLPQVEVRQLVAAEYSGWTTLYVSEIDRGDHRIVPAREERRVTTVRAVSLDDLLADEPRVDVLKLTAQGAEVSVLRGMRRTLSRNPQLGLLCAVAPALLERAGANASSLFDPLAEVGLRSYRIEPDGTTIATHPTVLWSMARAAGRLMVWFANPSGQSGGADVLSASE